MSMNESVTEVFPPHTSCSVRVMGKRRVMVLVGSCGGTDSGTYASPPSYVVFPLSLNVVNKFRPASC